MSMIDCYQMISDENELKWFFDHVIQKPRVNESYSMVFVCRHKKLTKDEQETIGLTRRESEFLSTQCVRLASFKEKSAIDAKTNWTFERFLKRVKRFNVDKGAYTTALGGPLPEKTLVVIFYVNPCDDIKVADEIRNQIESVKSGLVTALLNGKSTTETLHAYQAFGNLENNLKHFKAHCKGSRYWMDFDIDVPEWFKTGTFIVPPTVTTEFGNFLKDPHICSSEEMINSSYVKAMKANLNRLFGKGNYIIVDTSGGYHILVSTLSVHCDPHIFCDIVKDIYELGVRLGNEPYVNDKGECKFECIVNDSQIPGLPLPGTYQYGRPVTVLNKDDFND